MYHLHTFYLKYRLSAPQLDVVVDVVELRAQADASMPASNNILMLPKFIKLWLKSVNSFR